jgi:hypothetical protein
VAGGIVESRLKKELGIYNKYAVYRNDREDRPGYKHEGCEYFVLDMTHDPFAVPALRAYADACEKEGYLILAKELRHRANVLEVALGLKIHGDFRDFPMDNTKAGTGG